jgi:2-dehydro-3-deoxy-D-gluconate 5-dehydrogenase
VAAPKMFDLSGRVAVVTGGNGGIGLGIALGLAEAGASVAILSRNEQKSATALKQIEATGAHAIAIRLDVTDRASLAPAMDQVESTLGPLDILVNNAGIAVTRGALKLAAEDWDRVIETNLTSCFLLAQIAARSMVNRRRGKIINISSEYSIFGSRLVPSYSAAKGGLMQITKSLGIELASHGVQVNALIPGWISSEMTNPIKGTPLYDEIIMRTPAGRFGEPSDMAGAAVFLASDASNFITGSTIYVDGGYAIR